MHQKGNFQCFELNYNITSNYLYIHFYSQNNSNVNENIQESLDDLEPPNTEEETPSTSKVHQKKSKWLVH